MAGAGGILLDPRGQTEKTFAWGLGHKTNNEAEWMALMQGLDLTNMLTIPKLTIFGDLRQVIYKMIRGYPTGSINCKMLYDRITSHLSNQVEFFHILLANILLDASYFSLCFFVSFLISSLLEFTLRL